MNRMQAYYQALRERVVRVTVEDKNGDISTGTAFHIGEGYFATARHVIDGFRSIRLDHMDGFAMIESIEIVNTFFPSDKTIDVALLKTAIEFTPYHLGYYDGSAERALANFKGIPFGALIDDAVSDDHILSEVLLMGFPPIPFSGYPELVAVRGEVNASMKKYVGSAHYCHLISTVARGGFSGGPVIDDYGVLLGIFVESLVKDANPSELGFAAALSIEPLLRLLKDNEITLTDNFNILDQQEPGEYDDWYERIRSDQYSMIGPSYMGTSS
jgi:hypothetical protein